MKQNEKTVAAATTTVWGNKGRERKRDPLLFVLYHKKKVV